MGRCTCEKCISGILSPRMAWRMQNAAVQVAELIRDSMPEFPGECYNVDHFFVLFSAGKDSGKLLSN